MICALLTGLSSKEGTYHFECFSFITVDANQKNGYKLSLLIP